MIDANELLKKFTVNDFKNLADSYQLQISNETDREIILFQYDRYSCAEVDQHKAKLYFYTDTMIFKNYITGNAYNIYNFLIAMYEVNNWELDFKGALEIVEHFATGTVKKSIWSERYSKYKKKNYKPKFKIYDESVLNWLDKSYPGEWLAEGITPDACDLFEIREYKRLYQTVIPVRLNGNLIGIRIRNRNPDYIQEFGKYRPLQLLNGKIFSFSTNGTLYGWDQFKDDITKKGCVYLVEGEKSVLKSYSWFGHDVPTVAMFGHSMSQWKREMIKETGASTIYYIADCDFKTKEERKIWYAGVKTWCQPMIASGFNVYIVADWGLNYIRYKENAFDAKSPEIFNEIFERRKLVQ